MRRHGHLIGHVEPQDGVQSVPAPSLLLPQAPRLCGQLVCTGPLSVAAAVGSAIVWKLVWFWWQHWQHCPKGSTGTAMCALVIHTWAASEPQRLLHNLLGNLAKLLLLVLPHFGSIHT